MAAQRAKITEGGRLVIPAEFRRQLGLEPGATVVLDVADGELRVRSLAKAVERAQAILRPFIEGTDSLADELIRERHAEADRE
jgi:AbrB family looped-hinge helix DNA binding protein